MKEAHVTLHDVAARAGVSVATASRALSGIGVRQKNHTKVTLAAEQLGYVPNEAARSLRNVRTMTVGVVFNQLSGPLGTELLDALVSGLDPHGYSLFVATAQGRKERYDELVHRFLERRVDALLCVNATGTGAAVDRFLNAGVPVAALFAKRGGYDKLPLIQPSISEAVTQCLARLRELGHRHVAVMKRKRTARPIDAFYKRASDGGFEVTGYDYDEQTFSAVDFMSTFTTEKKRPTVLVAAQAEAIGILEACERMGVSVPKMLSIIAVRDDESRPPAVRLSLSMLHLDPSKVGGVAAEILGRLFSQTGGSSAVPDTTVQMGSWIERDSTGPAPHISIASAG